MDHNKPKLRRSVGVTVYDEATMPSPELAAQGYPPLHRAGTHIVGPAIAGLLPR